MWAPVNRSRRGINGLASGPATASFGVEMIALTRRARRRRALSVPFPDEWRQLLAGRLVHWNVLDAVERARLEELIRLFLVDKRWEGTAGFVLGDDVRVLISAMACLLILGLDYDAYHRVTWIEVQPTTMRRIGEFSTGVGGVASDSPLSLLGQASYSGPVTIAWDAAAEGARHPERGHNVVYHEFAHKLDMGDGLVDGTPVLPDPAERRRWIEVCTAVYDSVREGAGGRAARSVRRSQSRRVLRGRHRDLLRSTRAARTRPSRPVRGAAGLLSAGPGSPGPSRQRAQSPANHRSIWRRERRRTKWIAVHRGSAMASAYCWAYVSCSVQAQRMMLRSGDQA